MHTKITILLLPGLNGTQGLFELFLSAANTEDVILKVIPYPRNEVRSYRQLTADISSEIERIEGKVILLGESFGGPLSLFVANQHQGKVIGVVLAATFVTRPNLLIGNYLPWSLLFRFSGPFYRFRQWFSKGDKADILSRIAAELKKVPPHILAFRVRETYRVDARAQLKNFTGPILYLRGENDYVVPKWKLDEIVSIRPDTQIEYFKTEHFVLQDKPVQSWQAIARFIRHCQAMC